jgi:hypothetical protein
MWYYVPVDDSWEEVLGHNVYITSQYFSPNAKDWTASSGNRSLARDNLRGQKSLGPLKMSLEMADKVIVPQKKLCPAVS